MGKGNQNKGKPQQKKNTKFKQQSAYNKKQLAKVDKILQGRSSSKSKSDTFGGKGGKKDRFNKDNKDNKGNKGLNRANNKFSQKSNNPRSSHKNQERSTSMRNKNSHYNGNQGDRKTKQIQKQQFNKHKKYNRNEEQQEQQQNPKQAIKGNSLFKIIPENMDVDQFAALGGNSDDVEEQQGEDQLEQQDYDNEEEAEDELEDEIQEQQGEDEQVGDQQEMEDQEFDGQQGDGQQQEIQDEGSEDEQNGEQHAQDQAKEQQGQQQDAQNQQVRNQADEQLPEEQQDKEPVDISVISLQIQQTIQILMNVQKLGNGKPRKFYIQELKKLIHQYYGYNFELISHFLDFLNPSEMIQFFEANQTQRPLTIRTNTLKTRRKDLAQNLIQRGVNLDPLADWSNVGIKIYQTKVPIGATPEYLAGQYMLQSASSFLPVIALNPQVGEKILDMASAPGGKTTYIAQLMKNTGSIFANDLKKERLRALQFNLYRLGVTNTAVTCKDGKKYPSIFPSTFDRVLLDAPCTGLGIISKDHSIKANRLMIDIYKNAHLQRELLLAAIDCCKVNGTIVYSTCSVSPLQNEAVVNFALKRRFIKIVECDIEVGEQGLTKFVQRRFHVDLKKTRRIYPHVHNMDGFYVAKLIKLAKGKKQVKEEEEEDKIQVVQGQQIGQAELQ